MFKCHLLYLLVVFNLLGCFQMAHARYTAAQLEELMQDDAAFKALLKEALKGSPVSESTAVRVPLSGYREAVECCTGM